jgi:hypothetical protein
MTNRSILLVEGPSEAGALRALDRSIVTATALRGTFTLLHDLAHCAIDNRAMSIKMDMALYMARYRAVMESIRYVRTNLPAFSFGEVKWSASLAPLPANADRSPRLPDWYSDAFTRIIMPGVLYTPDNTRYAAAPTPSSPDSQSDRSEPPRFSYQLTAGTWSLLADSFAAVVRLFDRAIGALLLLRMLVRTALNHRPNARAVVLLILAICRRYGRRSEPDDHDPLLIRRRLVSMGSCPRV